MTFPIALDDFARGYAFGFATGVVILIIVFFALLATRHSRGSK